MPGHEFDSLQLRGVEHVAVSVDEDAVAARLAQAIRWSNLVDQLKAASLAWLIVAIFTTSSRTAMS